MYEMLDGDRLCIVVMDSFCHFWRTLVKVYIDVIDRCYLFLKIYYGLWKSAS